MEQGESWAVCRNSRRLQLTTAGALRHLLAACLSSLVSYLAARSSREHAESTKPLGPFLFNFLLKRSRYLPSLQKELQAQNSLNKH